MILSNRELAAAFWVCLFLGWVFAYRETRGSACAVVRASFHHLILASLALAGLYIALCVRLLAWGGLWTVANLKTTLFWAFGFAFLSMMNASKIDEDTAYFRKALRETLALTVAITFLVDSFTFSLLTEIILVPVLVLVTVMQAMSQSKPEHAQVESLMTWILMIISVVFMIHAGVEAARQFRDFATLDNGRDFLVPILLSLLFLPFLYLMNIYQVYEQVFAGLRWGIGDEKLRRYAKWRAFLTFGSSLAFLKRWRRLVLMESPADRRGIDLTFAELRVIRRHERSAPLIAPEAGWSPYLAKDFLTAEGLTTEDYHRSFDTWRAASRIEKLGKPYSLNTITYYIDGNHGAATELTLEMHIFDTAEEGVEIADKRFGALAGKLLIAAVGIEAARNLGKQLDDAETFDRMEAGCRVLLKKNSWDFPNRSGYEREFIISRGA
jgi:hypothetical protein